LDRLICCAFPRTASTFFTESLKVAYSNIEIAHIFHKIDVLKKEKNIITFLRKTEDAFSSWMTKIDSNDIEGNLDWYNRFMIATLDRVKDICIVDFESITSDVNLAIQICRNYYSLPQPNIVDSVVIVEKIKTEFPDRYSFQQNNSLIEEIKQSKNYQKSLDYFNKIKMEL
jgi:hypothetical protein